MDTPLKEFVVKGAPVWGIACSTVLESFASREQAREFCDLIQSLNPHLNVWVASGYVVKDPTPDALLIDGRTLNIRSCI